MFPLLTGLISGGASLLGSMFSSDTSAQNTQQQIAAQQQMQGQTEQFNAGQAQLNRDYQTSMSNTAYQRASADMEKAGLNPASMFGSGSAASSPSGATASVGTPSVPVSQSKGVLSGIGDAVNRGLDSAVTAKTYEKMVDEIASIRAGTIQKSAETDTERQRPALVNAERLHTMESAEDVRQNAALKRQDQILRGPATVEASGVLGSDTSTLEKVGRAKYGVGAASDMLAPFVSTATRLGGYEILKQAFKNRNSANAYRRGYDAGLSE